MSQPIWKKYKSLGDVGVIYRDTTGVYAPEAEVWQEYEDGGKTRFQVYRFSLDRLSLHRGKPVPYGFHKCVDLPHPIEQYEEWFSKDLDDIARSSGTTKAALARDLCSRDPLRRFWAYHAIGSHHGWENFDQYPLDISEDEAREQGRGGY